MNRIHVWLIFLLLTNAGCRLAKDPMSDTRTGSIQLRELRKMDWFRDVYSDYTPQKAYIDSLKKLKEYKVVVFLGLWCSDSRSVVPQVVKTLDRSGFPVKEIPFVLLDRKKECKKCTEYTPAAYGVNYVPTLIILNPNGSEKGRFVEIPPGRVEKVIWELIR